MILYFKLYFIIYAITVVPIFPPCPFHQVAPPQLPQAIPIPFLVHIHGLCIYVLWLLYFLCCTLHPQDNLVTTNFYFIPSLYSLIPPTPLVSGNYQNVLCIYESVSILLVCLFCFLDSIWHLSFSDLFHSAQYPLGPPLLPQMARFHSFLWLSHVPSYLCTTSLTTHLLLDN